MMHGYIRPSRTRRALPSLPPRTINHGPARRGPVPIRAHEALPINARRGVLDHHAQAAPAEAKARPGRRRRDRRDGAGALWGFGASEDGEEKIVHRRRRRRPRQIPGPTRGCCEGERERPEEEGAREEEAEEVG